MAMDSKDSKKKKLSALSMPGKRGDEGLEIDLLGGDDHDAPTDKDASDSMYDPDHDGDDDSLAGKMAGKDTDMDGGDASAHDLATIPDDELLAEIKKRGLDKQLDEEGDEGAPSDEDADAADKKSKDIDDEFSLRA